MLFNKVTKFWVISMLFIIVSTTIYKNSNRDHFVLVNFEKPDAFYCKAHKVKMASNQNNKFRV